MNIIASAIKAELLHLANPDKAAILQRFFKTGSDQYGEGDIFWGIQIPQLRETVKRYKQTPLEEVVVLLHDPVHEVRMMGAMLLVDAFKRSKGMDKQAWFEGYLQHIEQFNNWDLVDLTCPNVIGAWLWDKDRALLYDLACTNHLWKQRIAIISTFYFIRKGDFNDALQLSTLLIHHKHDLIHKAVGWMLREIGKRNFDVERSYLLDNNRYLKMPRTMLRYAIERFPDDERRFFMTK